MRALARVPPSSRARSRSVGRPPARAARWRSRAPTSRTSSSRATSARPTAPCPSVPPVESSRDVVRRRLRRRSPSSSSCRRRRCFPAASELDDGLRRRTRVRCARARARHRRLAHHRVCTPTWPSSSSAVVGNTLGPMLGWCDRLLTAAVRSSSATGSWLHRHRAARSRRALVRALRDVGPCRSGRARRSSARSSPACRGLRDGRCGGSSRSRRSGAWCSSALAGIGWAVGSSWHSFEPRSAVRRVRRRRGGGSCSRRLLAVAPTPPGYPFQL